MLSERQKNILWSIVDEHIKMAGPVSSKTLSEKCGFDIGAPMLRKEMNILEKEGYLAQPHTSAGRVPTDKAYRLYIQEKMPLEYKKTATVGLTQKESQKIRESLGKKWNDEQALLKEISKIASDISKDLSIAGTVGGENSYTCGFSNLFDEPEFRDFSNINQLMHFMDNVDSYFDNLWNPVRNIPPQRPFGRASAGEVSNGVEEDMQVFIGDENPIKEINEFTLITGKYQLPEGESGFVSIIGPKRMNYKRNMALVDYISKIINNV